MILKCERCGDMVEARFGTMHHCTTAIRLPMTPEAIASMPPAQPRIVAIHICSDGVYVQASSGTWFHVSDGNKASHHFAEIGNWSAEEWHRRRKAPPCMRGEE